MFRRQTEPICAICGLNTGKAGRACQGDPCLPSAALHVGARQGKGDGIVACGYRRALSPECGYGHGRLLLCAVRRSDGRGRGVRSRCSAGNRGRGCRHGGGKDAAQRTVPDREDGADHGGRRGSRICVRGRRTLGDCVSTGSRWCNGASDRCVNVPVLTACLAAILICVSALAMIAHWLLRKVLRRNKNQEG